MQFSRWIGLILLCVFPLQAQAQETNDARWFEVSSPNFVLFTDTSEAKGRRLLTDFEGRIGAFTAVFGPLPQRQFPIHIFLLNRTEDFVAGVPIGGTATIDKSAYVQKGPDRVFVIARDRSPEDIADDVGHALGHV